MWSVQDVGLRSVIVRKIIKNKIEQVKMCIEMQRRQGGPVEVWYIDDTLSRLIMVKEKLEKWLKNYEKGKRNAIV